MRHVQLIPADRTVALRSLRVHGREQLRAFIVFGGNIFDGLAAGGAETVRQVEFSSNLCNRQFAFGVIDLVDADRREPDRGGAPVPKDGGRRVSQVGVDELMGDYPVAEEGLPVRDVGVGEPGIGGGVVPAAEGEGSLSQLFQLARICEVTLTSAVLFLVYRWERKLNLC